MLEVHPGAVCMTTVMLSQAGDKVIISDSIRLPGAFNTLIENLLRYFRLSEFAIGQRSKDICASMPLSGGALPCVCSGGCVALRLERYAKPVQLLGEFRLSGLAGA
jgi:hypothetical protein